MTKPFYTLLRNQFLERFTWVFLFFPLVFIFDVKNISALAVFIIYLLGSLLYTLKIYLIYQSVIKQNNFNVSDLDFKVSQSIEFTSNLTIEEISILLKTDGYSKFWQQKVDKNILELRTINDFVITGEVMLVEKNNSKVFVSSKPRKRVKVDYLKNTVHVMKIKSIIKGKPSP